MENVGRTCFSGQNPTYQAELKQIVDKLDAYAARNGKDMTPAKVAEFKRTQGGMGATAAQLCHGDAVAMYRALETQDRAKMQAGMDELLSRDGPPTWGTCL